MADALKPLLRRPLRVATADGRVFLGTFVGTDKALNLLLVNTDEFRPAPAPGPAQSPHARYVGQVMIPWRRIVRVEAQMPGSGAESDDDADAGARADGDSEGLYM